MHSKGRSGEDKAALFLENKGLKIIDTNSRSRTGEIDIIAIEGETLVFVEVKTWSVYGIEALEQAINAKKQHKIIETSKYFLSLHREYRYMSIRFDVILITPRDSENTGITHLASAFTERV